MTIMKEDIYTLRYLDPGSMSCPVTQGPHGRQQGGQEVEGARGQGRLLCDFPRRIYVCSIQLEELLQSSGSGKEGLGK